MMKFCVNISPLLWQRFWRRGSERFEHPIQFNFRVQGLPVLVRMFSNQALKSHTYLLSQFGQNVVQCIVEQRGK